MTNGMTPVGVIIDNCSAIQDSTITDTAEHLIMANAVMKLDQSTGIVFNGTVYIRAGAGVTAVTVRFRRGYGITGSIDWEMTYPVPANMRWPLPISGIIGAGEYQQPNGGQHSITIEQNANSPTEVLYGSVAWFNTLFDH